MNLFKKFFEKTYSKIILLLLVLGASLGFKYLDFGLDNDIEAFSIWHSLFAGVFIIIFVALVLTNISEKKKKWNLLFLAFAQVVLLWDMTFLTNSFLNFFVPFALFFLIIAGYWSLFRKNVKNYFKIFLPQKNFFIRPFEKIGQFFKIIITGIFSNSFTSTLKNKKSSKDKNTKSNKNIVYSLLFSLPFLILFFILLSSADKNFLNIFSFKIPEFKIDFSFLWDIFQTFIYFLIFSIFAVSVFYKEEDKISSNESIKDKTKKKSFVVGEKDEAESFKQKGFWDGITENLNLNIFFGSISLLLFSFILLQFSYLFGGGEFLKNYDGGVSSYARDGFFQLLILLIISFSLSVIFYKKLLSEKVLPKVLYIFFIILNILITFSSLYKINIYEKLKGFTVMRTYVFWFDIFIILLLLLIILFLFLKYSKKRVLNVIAFLATGAFLIIASVNINSIIAKKNIERFIENNYDEEVVLLRKEGVDLRLKMENKKDPKKHLKTKNDFEATRKKIQKLDDGFDLRYFKSLSPDSYKVLEKFDQKTQEKISRLIEENNYNWEVEFYEKRCAGQESFSKVFWRFGACYDLEILRKYHKDEKNKNHLLPGVKDIVRKTKVEVEYGNRNGY